MTNEVLKQLLSLTVASSAGIVAALLMRRPARYVFGSGACYSLWLLVPVAMLAVLVPHAGSSVSMNWGIESVSAIRDALGVPWVAISSSLATAPSTAWQVLALSVWWIGAALFAVYLTLQQRVFVKSLGSLSGSRCVLRTTSSDGCPALLGIFWPKIILPVNFRTRYTALERLLIFSHERTHLRRGDAACNGFAALIRSMFWFNPLVHLASGCFRMDQEFACDAAVMREYPHSRRAYASAMLKTQLADFALPIGCHWRSMEALKERVQMLKRLPPSRASRLSGAALTALLAAFVGCTTWTAQPTLVPRGDVSAYDVRALGASADAARGGPITVRASVKNAARLAQPLPLLRVTFQDRWGNRIAVHDVAPESYWPARARSSYLSAGERIDAVIALVDPGAKAVGYEIDACLPVRGGGMACASDSTKR
jgi:beta-lactamase regulating signal transducer with metallopeptidase domain